VLVSELRKWLEKKRIHHFVTYVAMATTLLVSLDCHVCRLYLRLEGRGVMSFRLDGFDRSIASCGCS